MVGKKQSNSYAAGLGGNIGFCFSGGVIGRRNGSCFPKVTASSFGYIVRFPPLLPEDFDALLETGAVGEQLMVSAVINLPHFHLKRGGSCGVAGRHMVKICAPKAFGLPRDMNTLLRLTVSVDLLYAVS